METNTEMTQNELLRQLKIILTFNNVFLATLNGCLKIAMKTE
jgi:hypothetical protein